MTYQDREQAADRLIEALRGASGRFDLVLALPRGGVLIGARIASAFGKPLGLVLTQKITDSNDPEFVIGAITEEGDFIPSTSVHIDPSTASFQKRVEETKQEIIRRIKSFVVGQKVLVDGRNVLLVDDGIATGLSMRAAMQSVKHAGANTIMVGAPVASAEGIRTLGLEERDLFVPERPQILRAISDWYQDFPRLNDEEVKDLLHFV